MKNTQNFANSELTQLLPKINTDWTWEDIRLYLKENGYEIQVLRVNTFEKTIAEVNLNIFLNDFKWQIIAIDDKNKMLNDNMTSMPDTFCTYEEAREEAIKHCLGLISYK